MRAQSIRPICKGPEVSSFEFSKQFEDISLDRQALLAWILQASGWELGTYRCLPDVNLFLFVQTTRKKNTICPLGGVTEVEFISSTHSFSNIWAAISEQKICVFFFRLSSKVHHEVRHPDFFRPSIFEPARLPANVSSIPCELLQPGGKITLS